MTAAFKNKVGAPAPDPATIAAIVAGRHGDPFGVLGPHHRRDGSIAIATFAPDADTVEIIDAANGERIVDLDKLNSAGFFFATVDAKQLPNVGSSRVDLQACKLEYSIVSPK